MARGLGGNGAMWQGIHWDWPAKVLTNLPAKCPRNCKSIPPAMAELGKAVLLQTMWVPQRIIVRAQRNYNLFYGTRRLSSRSVVRALFLDG